jgi:hypothetical protein
VQNAVRVIPRGHELFGRWLQGQAQCERCYGMVLFGYDTRFGLVEPEQIRDREEPPKPTTETFETYAQVYGAMQRHAQSCSGRSNR